jgi:ADP-ribose pyrophosphatase YjhB (NUDIX family)
MSKRKTGKGKGSAADDQKVPERDQELVHYTAAGGVVIDGDRVLLLDRPSRNEVRLPKGHVKRKETVEAAALRETSEESGYADLAIVADLGSQVVTFEFDGRKHVRLERYMLMRKVGDTVIQRSAKDAAQFTAMWVPLQAAAEMLTYEAERVWLHRALDKLGGGDPRAT